MAIEFEIPHGGWCPKGRRAEDGKIPAEYQLVETSATDYTVRTEKNVSDSDGTLILFWGKLSGGTKLTARLAEKYERPLLKFDLSAPFTADQLAMFSKWVDCNEIETLNVAGPRSSTAHEADARTKELLRRVLNGVT